MLANENTRTVGPLELAGRRLLSADRVWLTLLGLFALLGLLDPGQAYDSLAFTADSFLWIAPFLVLSVVLAAWLTAAGADGLIGRVVAQKPLTALTLAAVFGALSPFCSCGVVPLVAALLAAGVPLPAVMAFWLASPLMDPEQFVLMWATLGLDFTLAKTFTAVALGLAGGLATQAAIGFGAFPAALRLGVGGGCGGLKSDAVVWRSWRAADRRRRFRAEAWRVGLFLGKWLLLAFALESLMVAWLPPAWVATALGGDQWYAIPLAAAVGVPAYLNGFCRDSPDRRVDGQGHAPGRRSPSSPQARSPACRPPWPSSPWCAGRCSSGTSPWPCWVLYLPAT